MSQIFHRSFNTLSKVSIVATLIGLIVLSVALYVVGWSPYVTQERVARVQPVEFSHEHHVGVLGIDCRYCHTSVETSSFAGIPATKICMNCHSQIWVGSSMLGPVRDSYRKNRSLRWDRVYNVPGFVYFDHSIHVHKGVGCSSCHGRIDQMPFTYQVPSLLMDWCLDCHRHPERAVRPRKDVFDMHYQPPDDQLTLGRQLVKEYAIKDARELTSCSVC